MSILKSNLTFTTNIPGLPSSMSIPVPSEPLTDTEAALEQEFAATGGVVTLNVNAHATSVSGGISVALTASESSVLPESFSEQFLIPVKGLAGILSHILIGGGKDATATLTISVA